jgi:hypothetical protein
LKRFLEGVSAGSQRGMVDRKVVPTPTSVVCNFLKSLFEFSFQLFREGQTQLDQNPFLSRFKGHKVVRYSMTREPHVVLVVFWGDSFIC